MQQKGFVLLKKEFQFTKFPDSSEIPSLDSTKPVLNMGKEYRRALAGKLCPVFDISCDKKDYLVFCDDKADGGVGQFLWDIDGRDTVEGSFLPFVKKNGMLVHADEQTLFGMLNNLIDSLSGDEKLKDIVKGLGMTESEFKQTMQRMKK